MGLLLQTEASVPLDKRLGGGATPLLLGLDLWQILDSDQGTYTSVERSQSQATLLIPQPQDAPVPFRHSSEDSTSHAQCCWLEMKSLALPYDSQGPRAPTVSPGTQGTLPRQVSLPPCPTAQTSAPLPWWHPAS